MAQNFGAVFFAATNNPIPTQASKAETPNNDDSPRISANGTIPTAAINHQKANAAKPAPIPKFPSFSPVM